MSMLGLPDESLQAIIDLAVQHTKLQHVAQWRQICRRFDALVQNSIFHLPKSALLNRRMGEAMVRKLIQSKMLLGSADERLLCYTINQTADHLAGCAKSDLRDRYVLILETFAAKTMMYWRLLECLVPEKSQHVPLQGIKENALVAAIEANEISMVHKLLKEGASAVSNTPFFGEALATAASLGSLAAVQLLLEHWDWETHKQLAGLRLMHAIEAAIVAGHELVLARLLDYKDHIPGSTFDDAVIRMVNNSQEAFVDRLLGLRREDSVAKYKFWSRLVRKAAEYDRQTFLQHILEKYSPMIEESLLAKAMADACSKNHDRVFQILLAHVSEPVPALYSDSLFWAAWFGNFGVLTSLFEFLQKDQRAMFLALTGAVTAKRPEIILYVLNVAGVYIIDQDLPTRFTDIIRLMIPDDFSHTVARCPGPINECAELEKLYTAAEAGRLADLVNVTDLPNEEFVLLIACHYRIANNESLDIHLFLLENFLHEGWIPHLETSRVASPAVAQILTSFEWDVGRSIESVAYPRLGDFVSDEQLSCWMLDNGAPADATGVHDITPTSMAIMRAPMTTVSMLLNRSSSIQRGQLLHFAVRREGEDSLEAVELLLNLGFPINRIRVHDSPKCRPLGRENEVGTSLFIAAHLGRDDIVTYLLSRGADATIISNEGRTALDAAELKGHSSTIRILREHLDQKVS